MSADDVATIAEEDGTFAAMGEDAGFSSAAGSGEESFAVPVLATAVWDTVAVDDEITACGAGPSFNLCWFGDTLDGCS